MVGRCFQFSGMIEGSIEGRFFSVSDSCKISLVLNVIVVLDLYLMDVLDVQVAHV